MITLSQSPRALLVGGALGAIWFATLSAQAATLDCRLSSDKTQVGGRIEIRIADTFGVDNPDDPRQADVAGVFVAPSGREWRMPGFLYREFERKGDALVETGKPAEWRVRFTPTEPGQWKASVRATIGGQTHTGDAGAFEVAPAEWRGILRRAKANPLAFEFDNGAPLIAIGSNVFPKTTLGQPVGSQRALDVIRQLEGTAKAGGTFCRLRMDSWFIPIELPPDKASGYQGAGRYHAQSCWEVDRIVEAAERLGLTLMLCISNSNANVDAVEPARLKYNLYLKQYGGPLESNATFWTDPEVKRLFAQKMRYSVARWGASPAIGVWEFFNEVKLSPEKINQITAWHCDLARQWRAFDPYQRLIATSPVGGYNPGDHWWKLFDAPEMDLVQYHTYSYRDLAAGIGADNLAIVKRATKPLIVGEFGSSVRWREELGSKGADPKLDPKGLHLHNGIWAGGLTGAAGALPWFITNYIDPLNLYPIYTGFSRFAADWKVNAGPWRPVETRAVARFAGDDPKRLSALTLPVREKIERPEADVYKVLRDGTIEGGATAPGFLFGLAAHKELRRPPTFEVDYPADGKFIVTVNYVVGKAGGKTPVTIELDGKPATRREFALGEGQGKKATHIPQYDNWNIVYGEELAIDVPAGPHRIKVDAQGTDRTSVSYTLTPYADRGVLVYRVFAMGLGGELRLWIQNSANTAYSHYYKQAPTDAPPAEIRVAAAMPGRYEAEWWDTYKGVLTRRETVEAQDGFVTLTFPGTLADEACKLRLAQ